MDIKAELMGKCGFYCGSCPTYSAGNCHGCIREHKPGECFTRDCVMESGLNFCGECSDFPCNVILEKHHTTVLDKEWLTWKKKSKTNR